MCDHENRERAMVVLDPGTPERHGRDGVWCDPCLAPIVKALNDGGLRTAASCCGHGRAHGSITLGDGRWLVVLPDQQAVDRLAVLRHPIAGAHWPGGMDQDVEIEGEQA